MIDELTIDELDAVSGGEGYVVNGVLRATTQWFQDHTFRYNFGWDLQRELTCPTGA